MAEAYARRTTRLTAALLGLVFERGGEASAREAWRWGMLVSEDTLRRIIHRRPLPPAPRPLSVPSGGADGRARPSPAPW